MLNAATATLLEDPRQRNAAGTGHVISLMRFLFDPPHYQKAAEIAQSQVGQLFVPVSPQACAAMTEACLRYCPRTGGIDVSQPNTSPIFANILLTFQEFLLPSGVFAHGIDFANLDENQFSLLARNYLGANFVYGLGSRPTRAFLMFEYTPPESEMLRRTGLTARAWFDSILGLDPLFFRILALTMFGQSRAFNLDDPDVRSLILNFPFLFAQIKRPVASLFRSILQRSVVDLDEVANFPEVAGWQEALYQFNYLRRKPLWALRDGRHLTLHPRFFVEKFFEGIAHVLTEAAIDRPPNGWSTSRQQRVEKVRSEFGYVFDDYCRTVLRTLLAGPNTSLTFGFEIDGRERDGLIAIPGTVLLFEFVQHPISAIERGTGNLTRFLEHLRDNVQKLANVRDEILAGRSVTGRLFTTERIIPIIVTSDTFPISYLNAEAFARALETALGSDAVSAKGRALPMQTLGIEQLEHLGRIKVAEQGYVGIVNFLAERAADILERFTANPAFRQTAGSVNLWADFDEAAERSMMAYSASIFRPETLPTNWYLGWDRFASEPVN